MIEVRRQYFISYLLYRKWKSHFNNIDYPCFKFLLFPTE